MEPMDVFVEEQMNILELDVSILLSKGKIKAIHCFQYPLTATKFITIPTYLGEFFDKNA